MTKHDVEQLLLEAFRSTRGNIIEKTSAGDERITGLRLYDGPVVGIAAADDELFVKFKQPGIVGPQSLTPSEWLPGAQSVISFFLPFSDRVKQSNAGQSSCASLEWVYARIEGQAFLMSCACALGEKLRERGYGVCIPAADPRFAVDISIFSSNWSERHAAFAAGLGTFGKSRGLITEKGMAGRFGSLIITEKIEADVRPYTDAYEYCIGCGACARRCPVSAIPDNGIKDQLICAPFVDNSKIEFAPRYGCGLCQTAVPCESGIPRRKT